MPSLNSLFKGTVFSNENIATIDKSIIPKEIAHLVNKPKHLELYLLQHAKLRNEIINVAQLFKVAMNFRSNMKQGCWSKLPWKTAIEGYQCIDFNNKADMFYYLSIPSSLYNRILTVAVRINQNLKLQLQFVSHNRLFCPRYKIQDKKTKKTIVNFNERVIYSNYNNYVKNNIMRALLGNSANGLPPQYEIVINKDRTM